MSRAASRDCEVSHVYQVTSSRGARRREHLGGGIRVAAIRHAGTGTFRRPGFAVDESFATGFMPDNGIGPVGVAADGSDIWVGDYAAGELYRFGPNGGLANQSTRVTTNPIRARLAGLTFGRDGRLYAALQDTGKVVELSKADGRVLRTVADGLPNATGLATDPLTGDLFVTQPGSAPGVKRIKNLSPGSVAVKTWYTNAAPPGQNGNEVDGISFGRDGTMYLSSSTQIFRVEGTNKASPARTSAVASVQNGDGIAVAAGKIASQPPYLLANRTDGTITKIDLTDAPPHKQTDIVTGDHAATSPRSATTAACTPRSPTASSSSPNPVIWSRRSARALTALRCATVIATRCRARSRARRRSLVRSRRRRRRVR